MKRALIATFALAALAVSGSASAEDFGQYWHDGLAELDGYRLSVDRYGQTREGYAVMIYVTEPFSDSKRVKVNDHTRNPSDVVDVLKLNLVRDFQTGIYDYNTMTSVFVRASDFDPLKVTFSSAEWCGHVYSEMVFRDRIDGFFSSYFEDESGSFQIDRQRNAVSEDNLFILLRGLRGEFLAAGQSRKILLLPSAYHSRLTHRPVEYIEATISRAKGTEQTAVPAGSFETARYDVSAGKDRSGSFWIEAAYPHRIVRWSLAPDVGELTGTARLKYWSLNGNGDERYLEEIGLAEMVKK